MRLLEFGPNKIELFDSVQTMPAHRFSEMQYYLLSDLGIGNTFDSINAHMSGIRMAASRIMSSKIDDGSLALELENLMLNYLTMISKYNPKYMAWLCLIHKYNGEEITDISEDSLKELGQKISEEGGIAFSYEPVLEILKKNFKAISNYFSPNSLEEEEEMMFI